MRQAQLSNYTVVNRYIVSHNSPYQHLPQTPRTLSSHPLLRPAQLDVHVAVDRHKASSVLGLAPLQADRDFVVDERLQHRPWVEGDEVLRDKSVRARGSEMGAALTLIVRDGGV